MPAIWENLLLRIWLVHLYGLKICGLLQDCEFTYLSTQILHVLGVEGPKTKDPTKYIRFIYNRIILENATVRAAAVSSLAKFGALVGDLRERVKVLLSRALHDNDDEVITFTLSAPFSGYGSGCASCDFNSAARYF